MYPIMSTGNTVSKAVNVLKEHGVKEECIILSNLFCTPQAVQAVLESYPKVIIIIANTSFMSVQQITNLILKTFHLEIELCLFCYILSRQIVEGSVMIKYHF